MNYDRVILEMLDRIKKLESDIQELKKDNTNEKNSENYEKPAFTLANIQAGLFYSNKRDKTKYFFDGVKYSKRRLVLAIVKAYVKKHPNITINELQTTFDASLQGSFGVVMEKKTAITKITDYKKRFFTRVEEEIKLIDGICLVCSQWTLEKINIFITRARHLGFEIIEIK